MLNSAGVVEGVLVSWNQKMLFHAFVATLFCCGYHQDIFFPTIVIYITCLPEIGENGELV